MEHLTAAQKQALAIKNMVKFRHEPHYVFWRNVYKHPEVRHPAGKEVNMAIWLNGREPPYMESREAHDLNGDKITHAVASMTYEGLQRAALCFFMLLDRLHFSPAEMVAVIDDTPPQAQKKAEKRTHPLARFSVLQNHGDDAPPPAA
ncbi:MAG: hypothetical protein IJ523_12770 [Succinivibrionaceae bacterium]|nr:hypothetical protein [Succinivibrionaceae bacterium]